MGILDSVIGGAFDWFNQKEQNSANDRQAKNQMDFQQRNSDTAYQRAAADMKLAGINPILAGKFGAASSPAGAMATMGRANTASSAMAVQKGMADTKKTEEETKIAKVQKFIKRVELILKSATIPSQKVKEEIYKQGLDMLKVYTGASDEVKAKIGEAFTPLLFKIPGLFKDGNQLSAKEKQAFDQIMQKSRDTTVPKPKLRRGYRSSKGK